MKHYVLENNLEEIDLFWKKGNSNTNSKYIFLFIVKVIYYYLEKI